MTEVNQKTALNFRRRRPQRIAQQVNYTFPSSPPAGAGHSVSLGPGTDIGRFTILKHLDSGSSAEIYLARDNVSFKNVAVKVIDAGPCGIDGAGQRLRSEKLLYDRISDHRHVIKVYDIHSIQWAGTTLAVLSMEFAEGKTLARHLNGEPAETMNWADGFAQMAAAVAALHRAGIYHRDIKPDNFLMAEGRWKLCDLGSAAASAGDKEVQYQWDDINRLGAVFYHILQKYPDTISGELAGIVDKCLGKDGIEPYRDIEQLLSDLIRINGSSTSDQQVTKLWEKACRCIEMGQFCDAIEVCSELLDKQPSHQQAIAMFNDLRARKDRAGQILETIKNANGQLTIGQKRQALRRVDSIYPNHPQKPDILARIGSGGSLFDTMMQNAKIAVENGRWEKAAALIEHAVEMNPDVISAQHAYRQISSVLEQIQSADQQKNTAISENDCQKAVLIDGAINEYLEHIRPQILLTLS